MRPELVVLLVVCYFLWGIGRTLGRIVELLAERLPRSEDDED